MAGSEDTWQDPSTNAANNESPYPFGEEFQPNRGSNWNDPEMQALLILLKEEADTSPSDFHNTYRKGPIYRRISERMRAIGFNRQPNQIQCKTKKWKSLYINVLKQRAKGKRVTCRYFKDLVEIFGDTADKLGASAVAEAGDDIVEIELSHGAAVAANKHDTDIFQTPTQPSAKESSQRALQLKPQTTTPTNRSAKKILQRSMALQRLSQRADGFGLNLSSDAVQSIYPEPEKADLVHFILLEDSNQNNNDAWQSFLLENNLLKLQLLEEDFGLTRIKMRIEDHWVRLTADDNGFIPLAFTPDSSYVIKGCPHQDSSNNKDITGNYQHMNHTGAGPS